MRIPFVTYIYVEDMHSELKRAIRDAGYANELDAEDAIETLYCEGCREIPIPLEWDTESGKIYIVLG